MPVEKTKALILRSVDFSETSKVLTLYTSDFGKLGVLAKGGRRLKSSFEVALDLLSVCSIGVIRKPTAQLDLLTEAVLLERFAGLRRNLPALYAAYYVAEILEKLTQAGEPHPALFEAALRTLRELAGGAERTGVLARFVLRLVSELGYAPNLQACAACGAAVPVSIRMVVSTPAGGLLCADCARRHHGCHLVAEETIEVMRRMLDDPEGEPLRLSDRTRQELWRLLAAKVEHLLGQRPRMAAMLGL